MNSVKVIRTVLDYDKAVSRIDELIDTDPSGEELDLLSVLVEVYESEHCPIDPPDPVEAIKFRMEQQGLVPKDLIPFIGSRNRVSEILNRKRALSKRMIRKLHDGLGIPLESLIRS